jgi:drug/metabolite transporter (DMT)-like permease
LLIVLSEVAGAVSFTTSKLLPQANLFGLAAYKILLIYFVSLCYIFIQLIFSSPDYLSTLLQRISDPASLGLFLAIAASDLLVNLLIFKTFQLEKAGIGASMNFLCLVWSLGLDVAVFGQTYSWGEITGGVLILATTTSIMFMHK